MKYGGIGGVVDEEEEEEEVEEEEEEELAEVLVKGVIEGVGISPATFCFFLPLFRASMFHLRTDASSSSVTRRPCEKGSLGWTGANWAAMLYNQAVVVQRGQFTGRLVQGLALVAVDIRLQRIADGCDGQELTASTIRLRVERDCDGKRIVHSSRDPQNQQMLAHDRSACPSMW